jgi:thiamine transport system substrate-binding protein
VVDFLLSQQFQVTVAANMFVYPSRQGVDFPAGWAQVASLPQSPDSLPGDKVQAGREKWIGQWRSLIEA